MKAHLMYPDRDFEAELVLSARDQELRQDLELDVLFDAMAGEDEFLRKVASTAVLSGGAGPDTITYRQETLADCLTNPALVRETYNLVVASIEEEREARWWGLGGRSPSSNLASANKLMAYYVSTLRRLRDCAAKISTRFRSAGLRNLCAMLESELDEDYLESVEHHLRQLGFRRGVLIGAKLGDGNKGGDYVVRKPNEERRTWIEKLLSRKPEAYTYTVAERDDAGARALSELRDRGMNSVANALAQSVDHIRSFYQMLRTELAFYVACLNLRDCLSEIGESVCMPEPARTNEGGHKFKGLYDVCLALTTKEKTVGNEGSTDGRGLVVITGANHGGKSTFLRSVGLAQLMMQCGMFVGAQSFEGRVYNGVFTHFRRKEDTDMDSGKFDEELKRMSEIVDELSRDSLVLLNEPFAATNEREGSEVARQVVRALVENGVTVFVVTHLYDFARSVFDDPPVNALFLRANRGRDGSRNYKLSEGPPLETSYGRDLYEQVFDRSVGREKDQEADSVSKAPAGPTDPPSPTRWSR